MTTQENANQQDFNSNMDRKGQQGINTRNNSIPLHAEVGHAVSVALLLQDWNKFGLTERVCYHFALSDALHLGDHQSGSSTISNLHNSAIIGPGVGRTRLLECVPTRQWHKLTRREKRALKQSIQQFNSFQNRSNQNEQSDDEPPPPFPLKMNPQTRVYFAYEMNRIVVCLDASPTLTSTFGISNQRYTSNTTNSFCCPMDRFIEMSKQFWTSLVAPIATLDTVWRPEIAVTVLAVFPRAMVPPATKSNTHHYHQHTDVLVRDYRVVDLASADILCSKIQEWCWTVIETDLAQRLSHHAHAHYDEIPLHASRWQDLIDAGAAALSTLSSAARPMMVVATDGRSVACDGVLDHGSSHVLIDTPVTVLDLSSPEAHLGNHRHHLQATGDCDDGVQFLNHDPRGALFPLHLSDDSEAVYRACRATGGSFFDADLLALAAQTQAGCQSSPASSPQSNILERDSFFAWKRHSIQPNAVQWYLLFTLSPLSPTMHSTWGRLPPPLYIERRLFQQQQKLEVQHRSGYVNYTNSKTATAGVSSLATALSTLASSSGDTYGGDKGKTSVRPRAHYHSSAGSESVTGIPSPTKHRDSVTRTTFSTYIINPIPINEILLMRVKEGYRAKQYGQMTSEHDRVLIQFVLDLDLGTTIHYELSYKALPQISTSNNDADDGSPYFHRMIGSAHIKIELSGDAAFISSVKNDFLLSQQQQQGAALRGRTMAQQISARLCTHLRWIRKEDTLQSNLSPLQWSDQLSSPDTPFIRRLGSLSEHQRRRHFCLNEMDCVLTGRLPWEEDDIFFLCEFRDYDDGEQQLVEAVREWSTQTIHEGRRFVRQTKPFNGVAGYCVVELIRSPVALRVFTIALETFGGMGARGRLALIASLKNKVRRLKSVEVLPKQMAKFLVGHIARTKVPPPLQFYQGVLESHHNHASWDLVKDPKLLPLLMKRRKEIGHFYLLESSCDRALFARLFREGFSTSGDDDGDEVDARDPGNLAQYQMAVHEDKVVVDLYMECEGGTFFPIRHVRSNRLMTQFHLLVRSLKIRDTECSHALRCRTTLLENLGERPSTESMTLERSPTESHLLCVQRLLAYASRMSIRLRFFHNSSGAANNILESMTIDMMLSQSSRPRVAKLMIDRETTVDDVEPGDWFIVEYDTETVSIVHLSQKGENDMSGGDGRANAFRVLTFFTFGVSDLYSIRDDVAEGESNDGHISEHLQVSEFSETILRAHMQNYSSAAYLALRRDSVVPVKYFDLDDFAAVLQTLEFVEVARVIVGGEAEKEGETSKLSNFLGTVLHPIADESYCLYYENYECDEIVNPIVDSDSDTASVFEAENTAASLQDEERTQGSTTADNDVAVAEDRSHESSLLDESGSPNMVPSPIFVRFLLDDVPVPIEKLSSIRRSSSLAALVSVFKTKDGRTTTGVRKAKPSELPTSHLSAALEISSVLNAYVAEQNLERLRYHGASIEENDIQLAKTCLRKARHILSSTLDVYFYVARTDFVVAAAAPSGSKAEIEGGFNMLASELRKVEDVRFRPYQTNDNFLVETIETGSSALAYWCFVKIHRALGSIFIDVHHPGGAEAAADLMSYILQMISICCHRVNQMILLRSLHRSRTASRLLIPPDDVKDVTMSRGTGKEVEAEPSPFHDGVFSCPIVYRTSFELYHRCASNPRQVARALEATVLHIFAISNRRKSYVYKDEAGAVFYLGLSVIDGGDPSGNIGTERGAQVELLVYGIDTPGPSVTVQLRNLLQKKLLSIAVDMLSAVLTKNPQYHWRHSDIDFVRSFESAWNSLESERRSSANDAVRTYAFPPSVFDPGMVVLYFKQNICGSTFFHCLCSTEWTAVNGPERATVEGANLHFAETDLVIYFNTAPSKLDPSFQAESTLTRRGAELSGQTGPGIAIIEVIILDADGRELRDLVSAIPPAEIDSRLEVPCDSLRFQLLGENLLERAGKLLLQIRITDTALNRNILHEWIKLSLDQVLTAWNVEKQLERMQRNLLRHVPSNFVAGQSQSVEDRLRQVELICSGLPALTKMLEFGVDLPHPAILKLECAGVIRSSAVASVALDLLESGILDHLRQETRKNTFIDPASQMCIVRSSRSAEPRRVTLQWDSRKNTIVKDTTKAVEPIPIIKDSPIDCPEYTIFFHSANYIESHRERATKIPKLFEEVLVGFEGAVDALESLRPIEVFKRQNLSHFRTSFAFVFSVKRNRRVLLAYNWNVKLFKSIVVRLKEKDASFLFSTGQSVASLQLRSLGRLAPPVGESNQRRQKADNQKSSPSQRTSTQLESSDANLRDERDAHSQERKAPRVARPMMIRRPKLVGKSVEGSAIHAVARSRALASAKFRGGTQSSSNAVGSVNVSKVDSTSGRNTGVGSVQSVLRPPRALEITNSRKLEDNVPEMVKNAIKANVAWRGLVQQPSLRAEACRKIATSIWPIKSKQDISSQVADFVFSMAPMVWFNAAEMLPIPVRVLKTLLMSLGQTVGAWTTGLANVSVRAGNEIANAFYLMGKMRNVRNSKCCVVIKLSIATVNIDGKNKNVVVSEGRILTFPRRRGDIPLTQAWQENDGAGLNKLAADTHELLGLQGILLDHAASIIERTMKSDSALEYSSVLRLLTRLIDKYPLHPMIALRSNYKCYRASIVLRSYDDRFIDRFDGVTLFKWLCSNSERRNSMLNCGSYGLCFKKEIIVGATHSICFLSPDDSDSLRLTLNILCRSQNTDLREFMFREGSTLAVSILDNITIEAAGLAYKDLEFAARSLEKERLWYLCSSTAPRQAPSFAEVSQMMVLCSRKPISDIIESSGDAERLSMIYRNSTLVDFKRFCASMKREPVFQPSWDLIGDDGRSVQYLFYFCSDDIFFLLQGNRTHTGLQIDLIERDNDQFPTQRASSAVQKLTNFLLHFVWSEMLS